MTKANTLPKIPPAIAAMRRKVFECDVVADGWIGNHSTTRRHWWMSLW